MVSEHHDVTMSLMSQCHLRHNVTHITMSYPGPAPASEEPGEEAGGCHAAEERTTGVHEVGIKFLIIDRSCSS